MQQRQALHKTGPTLIPAAAPHAHPATARKKVQKRRSALSKKHATDPATATWASSNAWMSFSLTSGGQGAVLCRHRQQLPTLTCHQP